MAGRPSQLTRNRIAKINVAFRRRTRSVEGVDRMVGEIEQTLTANGIARETYLIISFDNGLHTGEYRLIAGKLTAFNGDIHVPLAVVCPGTSCPAGAPGSRACPA